MKALSSVEKIWVEIRQEYGKQRQVKHLNQQNNNNKILTKVIPGQDTLHRMISRVSITRHSIFVTGCTAVIIEANETLVPPASKVSLQT